MKPEIVKVWMVLRTLLILTVLLIVFYLPTINQPRIPYTDILAIVGMIIFLFGITLGTVSAIQLLRRTKFHSDKIQIDPTPDKLVTTGLYKIVRHPIYFTGMIALFSWCLFWRAFYCLFFLVPIFIIGLTIKAFQEQRDLEKVFGEEYEEYKRKVGMLFPKMKKSSKNR